MIKALLIGLGILFGFTTSFIILLYLIGLISRIIEWISGSCMYGNIFNISQCIEEGKDSIWIFLLIFVILLISLAIGSLILGNT